MASAISSAAERPQQSSGVDIGQLQSQKSGHETRAHATSVPWSALPVLERSGHDFAVAA
jgi:hypothetical protein